MARLFRKRIAPTGAQWTWILGFSCLAVFFGNDTRVETAAFRFLISMAVWVTFALIGNAMLQD